MRLTLAELERELRRMRECGCDCVEVVVGGRRSGSGIYVVVGVDRPSYRTSDDGVAVLTLAPAR